MLKRVGPVGQFLPVALFAFPAFIERIAEVVMALALQPLIGRKQSLTERFERLAVFLHLISSRAGIEIELVRGAILRMCLERLLKLGVGIVELSSAIGVESRSTSVRAWQSQEDERGGGRGHRWPA